MFGSNLWGSILGRMAGVPVVIAHEQTWSYEGQPLRRFLDGHVIGRLADVFVAVSERDRQRMIDLEGVPAEKIVVLPNPYVPRADRPSIDYRQQLQHPLRRASRGDRGRPSSSKGPRRAPRGIRAGRERDAGRDAGDRRRRPVPCGSGAARSRTGTCGARPLPRLVGGRGRIARGGRRGRDELGLRGNAAVRSGVHGQWDASGEHRCRKRRGPARRCGWRRHRPSARPVGAGGRARRAAA